jgi:hypothetical protein
MTTSTIENDTRKQKSEARKAIREAVKFQKKVEAVKAQPELESLTITIEWRKSRMWGWNPYATGEAITKEGYRMVGMAKASGCGYCKRSTVIADLFNQFLRHKLYDQKVISGLCKSKPYGIRLREVGKNWLSYFEGGIGEDCYSDISKAIGGTWKQIANAKHVDVYQYKEIQK